MAMHSGEKSVAGRSGHKRPRWRPFVLVGLAALLVFGIGSLLRSSGAESGCWQTNGDAHPDIVRRADELLALLATEPPKFVEQTTEEFRRSQPADLAAATKLVSPALNAKRELRGVWRIHDESPPGESGAIALCKASPPYADTVPVGAGIEDAAVVFYDVDLTPLSWRLHLKLIREGDIWRAHLFSGLPSRHRGRGAEDFEKLGDARATQGLNLEALVAYLAADSLSKPPTGMETIAYSRFTEKLKQIATRENLERILSRERIPREHEYLHVAMAVTDFNDLLPEISFVSAKGGDATRQDANALFEAVERAAPSLRVDFAGMLMIAYEEPPANPRRTYSLTAILLRFDQK